MEVACSFDEIAQALAEDGYIHADSYFNVSNPPDLPSMLRVFDSKSGLDSPESFPESPCSDEDIARVLEITQMSSPPLLESCIPDSFVGLPTPQNDLLVPNNIGIMKTRDPCITNAVLHDVFSNNSSSNFSGRSSGQLDGFCLSSSLFSHSVSVNLNHVIDSKENDVINTSLFDSTPVLSPLSESDHIQTHPNLSEQTNQFTEPFLGDNLEITSHQQLLEKIPDSSKAECALQDGTILEQQSTGTSQKRKRKRKSFSKSSKSRKAKKKTNADPPPKPQPKPKKAKLSEQNTPESKQNTSINRQQQPDPLTTTSALSIPQEEVQNPTQFPTDCTSDTLCQKEEPPTLRRSSRSTRNTENYNFRLSSLVKRVETERRQKEPKQPKGKAKPPPLSKYRRRTANARERDRMKEINDAFDVLKNSLPNVEDESKQKATKFTILKLALNYISALREMLGYEELSPSAEGMDIAMSLSPDNSTSSSHDEKDLITETSSRNPSLESYQLSVSSPQDAGRSQSSIPNSLVKNAAVMADDDTSTNAQSLNL